MYDEELFCTLKLYRSPNIGPVNFFYLIDKYKTAANAINNIEELSDKWNRPIKLLKDEKVEEEILKTFEFGAKFLLHSDSLYPNSLLMTKEAPPVLIFTGREDLFEKTSISIVGTREPSINGIRFASQLAEDLGQEDFVITSGFAKGIDIEAHKSSMETGTIAVMAGGISTVYPQENAKYFNYIKSNGLIISEMPIDTNLTGNLFPKRNNIIAGLSWATIVIESIKNSGALITAKKAFDYGRKVFAVPGHPYDKKYKGNNYLLKNGAKLLEDYKDIIEEKNKANEKKKDIQFTPFGNFSNQERLRILDLIPYSPVSIEDLSIISSISISKILSIVIEMEIAGIVKINENNEVYRIE